MLSSTRSGSENLEEPRRFGGAALDMTLATLTLVSGMFLPIVSAFIFPDGLVNVPWGSLYGIGFALLDWMIGLQRGSSLGFLYVAAGFFIWPGVVVYAVIRFLRLNGRKRAPRLWLPVRMLVLLSLLFAIPIPDVQGSRWEDFPIFTKYIDF